MSESVSRSSGNSRSGNKPDIKDMLSRPVIYPFFIVMSLMAFQQWSGVNAIIFYTVTIFRESKTELIDNKLATVIVGIVQFLATFGKRKLQTVSKGFCIVVARN
jgi:facilitated trehalose transporter